jgi:HD superfamily phosphohydrolase
LCTQLHKSLKPEVLLKERESNISNKKSLIKAILNVREIIGENKIKKYEKETGNEFCNEHYYDDIVSLIMEKYYGEKEYYKKIEAGEIDVDNMVFRDFDPFFW